MAAQPNLPRRHLRDAATICPAVIRMSDGRVCNRCERELGHDGKHKDGCAHWGKPEGGES
ncbi:hypothetical protein [Streptomyces sp. NPDC002467]|uniref:hypothetical protein n=1 Tax=Streptomyces sp. NPDC002467 TaxID=3364647 RepID=UPI00368E3E39